MVPKPEDGVTVFVGAAAGVPKDKDGVVAAVPNDNGALVVDVPKDKGALVADIPKDNGALVVVAAAVGNWKRLGVLLGAWRFVAESVADGLLNKFTLEGFVWGVFASPPAVIDPNAKPVAKVNHIQYLFVTLGYSKNIYLSLNFRRLNLHRRKY